MKNYSYVTVLTDDSYVYGVILLKETLKQTEAKYPLTVLITDNVSEPTIEILDQIDVDYKKIDTIPITNNIFEHNKNIDSRLSHTWKDCWTKFRIFDQTQFDKIVFLDADIMILKNLDDLFDKPHMTSCLDGEYFNIWPGWDHFNSGCIVIEPSHEEFESILNFACTLEDLPNYVIADQEILNLYFKDWPEKKELHLNKYYDIFSPYVKKKHLEDLKENTYFIHYVGTKPWQTFKLDPDSEMSDYFYEAGSEIIQKAMARLNWDKIYEKVIVTVYAICKNERLHVERWLNSFGTADYVCVLDTGSTDGTWEYLQEQAKIRDNIIIQQKVIIPWRYDEGRNESLKLVPKETVMYFMADLDEYIKDPNWVEIVRHSWNPAFSRGRFTYHRIIDPVGGIALKTIYEFRIHNKKWNKYENIVHEHLIDDCGNAVFFTQDCTPINIAVLHDPLTDIDKNYIQLCINELKENPDNRLMELQLALEYQDDKQYDKARECCERLINYPHNPEKYKNLQQHELGACYYIIAFSYFNEEDYKMALTWLGRGRTAAPHFYDNYKLAADIYYKAKLYYQAKDLITTALHLCVETFWCNMFDIASYEPYFTLAKIAMLEKDYISSLGYLAMAEARSQGNTDMDIYYLRNQALQEQFNTMTKKAKEYFETLNESKLEKE